MKPRRTARAKRPSRELDAKTNRARRREQFEQAERTRRRPRFPDPEEGEYHHERF